MHRKAKTALIFKACFETCLFWRFICNRKAKTALIFKACFETCLFWRFICKVHENLVSLQCQMGEVEAPHFKDKNCEI